MYARLKNYVRHTHIKDLRVLDGKDKYIRRFGKAKTPIFEAIDLVIRKNITAILGMGKLWHPEIDACLKLPLQIIRKK